MQLQKLQILLIFCIGEKCCAQKMCAEHTSANLHFNCSRNLITSDEIKIINTASYALASAKEINHSNIIIL